MIINKLSLKNYRIYDKADIELINGINVFVGSNGVGKTSLLEACYYMCFSKSYKSKDEELVKDGCDFSKITCLTSFENEKNELSMVITKKGKKAIINGVEIKKLSEFVGKYNVVLFAPEDLYLIKGSPQERRTFMDLEIGQVSKEYLEHLSLFKKHLKYRNDLLKLMNEKGNMDEFLLDSITSLMIEEENQITNSRREFIKEINELIKDKYKSLTGIDEKVHLKYQPCLEKYTLDDYKKDYLYDFKQKNTSKGVQKDEVLILKDGVDVKKYCSQGEIRTVSLSLKLALIEYINIHKKQKPILLLDDVFSELDTNRQQKLLEYVNFGGQVIITTTNLIDIKLDNVSNIKIFEIKNQEDKKYEYSK